MKMPYTFLKRTNKDVNMLCQGKTEEKLENNDLNVCPYGQINKVCGYSVVAEKVEDGQGYFVDYEDAEQPVYIGRIASLNYVGKFKGFDFGSFNDVIVFDEFIPNAGEVVKKDEGKMILDFIKTVWRDEKPSNKFIALANATNPNNPLMRELGLVDELSKAVEANQEYMYLEERGVLIHLLPDNPMFLEDMKETPLYKATMGFTDWANMAYGNEFAYSDWSHVKRKINFDNYKCEYVIKYKKTRTWYVMMNQNEAHMYVTTKRMSTSKETLMLDFDKDGDALLFLKEIYPTVELFMMYGKCDVENIEMWEILFRFREHIINKK